MSRELGMNDYQKELDFSNVAKALCKQVTSKLTTKVLVSKRPVYGLYQSLHKVSAVVPLFRKGLLC